jgi:protein O-mannosyl-transferase
LKDTLSGFFMLLSLWFFVESERGKSKRCYWASLGAAVLAYLSKGSAVVLPALAFATATLGLRQPWRDTMKKLVPMAAFAIPIIWITYATQPSSRMPFEVPEFWVRPFIALDAVGFYLAKFFIPEPLLIDYGRTPSRSLHSPEILLTFLLAVSMLGLIYRWRNDMGRRLEVLGASLFLLGLFPTLGLVPFFHQATSTVTNRYFYISAVGMALLFAALVRRFENRKLAVRVGIGALVVFAVLSHKQLSLWRDGITLLTYNVEKRPDSWLARNNLGSAYEKVGDLKNAIVHYQIATQLLPSPLTFNNLGAVALGYGDYKLAEQSFARGVALFPDAAPNYQGLALSLAHQGKIGDARHVVEQGLKRMNGELLLTATLRTLDELERGIASKPK